MKKLSKEEFADALHKGKGLAFMYVHDNGDEGIHDEILRACLHELGYDPQSEGDRGRWMYKIIEHTKNPDFYYQEIFAQFQDNNAEDAHWQAWDLLEICEKNSNPEAKDCLLWIYEHTPCSDCRRRAVRKLIEIKKISQTLQKECIYDCNEAITKYFL